MSRYKFSHHTFDMSEYFSGERFVVGGMVCDWETPEEDLKKIETEKCLEAEVTKIAPKKARKKTARAPEVN